MGQSASSLPVKIDVDDKNQLLARGYRLHHGRCALAMLAIVLTFGLLLIPILARKDFKMLMFYKECSLQHATKVLIKASPIHYYKNHFLVLRTIIILLLISIEL